MSSRSGLGSGSVGLSDCGVEPGEGREHRQRLGEHRHVLARLLFQRAEHLPRGVRQRRGIEAHGELIAEFLLVLGEVVDREFEIARDQHLHAVAVKTDQLSQKRNRHKSLAVFAFLLENDLGQHRSRDVFARLRIIDEEVLPLFDHLGEVFEGHIGAGAGIIEAPVRIFLDRDRLFVGGHGRSTPYVWGRSRWRAFGQRSQPLLLKHKALCQKAKI